MHGVITVANILNMLALLLDYLIKEEARMKYINANLLLPDKLVKELQRYIQGGYIYVPVDEKQRRYWGELSGYKEELRKRNSEIAFCGVVGIRGRNISATLAESSLAA